MLGRRQGSKNGGTVKKTHRSSLKPRPLVQPGAHLSIRKKRMVTAESAEGKGRPQPGAAEREWRKGNGKGRDVERDLSMHLPENIRDLHGEMDTVASKDFKLMPRRGTPHPCKTGSRRHRRSHSTRSRSKA